MADSKFFFTASDLDDNGKKTENSIPVVKNVTGETPTVEVGHTANEASTFRPFFVAAGSLDSSSTTNIQISEDSFASRIHINENSPKFNRSPHYKTAVKTTELKLPQKERTGDKPEFNWMTSVLPQGIMLLVMIAVYMFSGVGSLVYTVPMYCVTMLSGVLSYISQKNKFEKRCAAAESQYVASMEKFQETIKRRKKENADVLYREYPSIEDCENIVVKRTDRLWRVRPDEEMFLTLRLGLGAIPSNITIQTSYNDDNSTDVIEKASVLSGVPVTCSLKQFGSIGIIGERTATLNTVRTVIVQAATNHSYDELKLVLFYPLNEQKEWAWARWLPHVWSNDRQNRYIANTREEAVKLCKEMEDIFNKRTGPGTSNVNGAEHYLIIIGDSTLIHGETFVNLLSSNNGALGISSVLVARDRSTLPSFCKAIVEANNGNSKWYPTNDTREEHIYRNDTANLATCDQIARKMAPIRLIAGNTVSKMPGSVTFMEGYGVREVKELDITSRWSKTNYGKSLSVPIGIRDNGELFYFDINRKNDGPHGMVAGGTGSGKSDLVQSWILSMALHYKPTEVSFIIVDYKGDGLLAPFRKLPHLVGTISNLDSNVERNVSALRSELDRRQLLFKDTGTHNIEDYIEHFKHGETRTPLPYLIVIIDEFADFKSNHPEFMPIVNEIYTKGASLGIYCMILAQDAAAAANGSVIPVNSHFHWCMKVDSDEASTGMLETHDAYTMTKLPGRGFVKVGNFETYEKIQAFWSGAYYNPTRNKDTEKIPPVAKISTNGTRTRLYSGTLDWEKSIGLWSSVKEIDVIVEYICQQVALAGEPIPAQIWQPPVPDKIFVDTLLPAKFSEGNWPDKGEKEVILGVADDPKRQKQYILAYKFSSSGHISVQGGPESGKTTSLITAAMSLVQRYDPSEVEMYLFDYDKWSLNLIRNLPHVKGSSAAAEPDEIRDIVKSIQNELSKRRILFLKAGAISLEGYNEIATPIPAIVIFVDNISAAWDDASIIQEMLYDVAQKGAGYGIYLVATAPGTAFPYKLTSFFKTKLTLRQNDRSDYTGIVGKSDVLPENYPGRGLAKIDYPVEFQAALPASGQHENERNHHIHDIVEEMKDSWHDVSVPTEADALDWKKMNHIGEVILGVDKKMMDPVSFSAANRHCLLVSGTEDSSIVKMLTVIVEQAMAVQDAEVIIFDDTKQKLKTIGLVNYYACGDPEADQYIASLMDIMSARAEGKGKNISGNFDPIYMVITDWKDFFENALDETIVYLKDVVEMGQGLGVNLVVGGVKDGIQLLANSGDKLTNRLLKQRHIIFMGGSIREHNLVQTQLSTEEECAVIADDSAWYILGEKAKSIYLLQTGEE